MNTAGVIIFRKYYGNYLPHFEIVSFESQTDPSHFKLLCYYGRQAMNKGHKSLPISTYDWNNLIIETKTGHFQMTNWYIQALWQRVDRERIVCTFISMLGHTSVTLPACAEAPRRRPVSLFMHGNNGSPLNRNIWSANRIMRSQVSDFRTSYMAERKLLNLEI